MHDPMVVAIEIRRPWPKVRKLRTPKPLRLRGAFWSVAGCELYWPGLITIWHVEPNDADAGTHCKPRSWKRHVHHWQLQVHPWQHFRRWAFTRCAWCGGPSRRGDVVNVGEGWGSTSKPKHWWQGEIGLCHLDCSSIQRAHSTCTCSLIEGGPWSNGRNGLEPWGRCDSCGGFRLHQHGTGADIEVRQLTTDLLKQIGKGRRDPAITSMVNRLWRDHRASTRSDAA